MVALVLTSNTSSPIKTSCINDILPVTTAFDQPVFKDSFVSALDFKLFQLSRSLNVKRSIKAAFMDWPLLQDLSDFGKKDKKS